VNRTHHNQNRFAAYAWGVLALNVLVILWGAFVRATGSGAGCGSDWPLCNGALLPDIPHHATFIEFAHRLSSGAALLLVVGLLVWCWRRYPRGAAQRWASVAALVFILIEALLGAGLVVFELVADNASAARVVWMGLHLVNTFLLLAPLTLIAWWASGGKLARGPLDRRVALVLGGALFGTLLLGMSGAIAALGDTLFPAASLAEGIRDDMHSSAPALQRLRLLHPVLAALMCAYVLAASWFVHRHVATPVSRRLAQSMVLLFVLQMLVGALNVVLLVPIAIQMLHLLLAVLIWGVLVLLTNEALAARAVFSETVRPVPETTPSYQGNVVP
jgi:heme A synthase